MKKLLSLGIAVMMVATLLAAPALADKTMDQIEKISVWCFSDLSFTPT